MFAIFCALCVLLACVYLHGLCPVGEVAKVVGVLFVKDWREVSAAEIV